MGNATKFHESETRRRRTPLVIARILAAVAAGLACAGPAAALINPNFTPVHLTDQSELILVLKPGAAGQGAKVSAKVLETVKGKGPASVVFDTSEADKPQAKEFFRLLAVNAGAPILMFTGDYQEEAAGEGLEGGAGGGAEVQGLPDALVHIHGKWFSLVKGKGGVWYVDAISVYLQETWAGGTDMLLLCVKYTLKDDDPEVPAKSGAAWEEEPEKIGKVTGTVRGAMAVDLKGAGEVYVHVLADGGDHLLRYDKKTRKFTDLTGRLKLGAKSRAAAWSDLNADGRLDLASWDGRALSLWMQGADGTFRAEPTGIDLGGECLGLVAVGVGPKMRAGLLVSRKETPLLVAARTGGKWRSAPIAPASRGAKRVAALGRAHACLVADFDGDKVADVLQPFEKGALFYKGTSPGAFAAPRKAGEVGTGPGQAGAFVGDYDHDGRFDVFVAAEEGCQLWNNQGGAVFAERLGFAGEAAYISQPNAHGGNTCDINNDGRQDIFILYNHLPPHLFFNRGYRSFGHAHALDIKEQRMVPGAGDDEEKEEVGQPAGLVHDVDRDGAQDMVLVLKNGEVWMFWRSRLQGDPLCLRAALPIKGPAGPVTVTAWDQARCLGVQNVAAGTSEAFFGLYQAGPIVVAWQFPGGPLHKKRVLIEDKPRRVLLTP